MKISTLFIAISIFLSVTTNADCLIAYKNKSIKRKKFNRILAIASGVGIAGTLIVGGAKFADHASSQGEDGAGALVMLASIMVGGGLATVPLDKLWDKENTFEKVKLERLHLDIFAVNKAAKRVYEKCGFREIGKARKNCLKKGRLYDEYFMEILRSDWVAKFTRDVMIKT